MCWLKIIYEWKVKIFIDLLQFKYILIVSLLVIVGVRSQDMPPPDLPTIPPRTTEGPTTTTTEAVAITTEAITTTEMPEITTTASEVTTQYPSYPHYPYYPHYPHNPRYPQYPNQNKPRCYYKKQYGYVQTKWTCRGKFIYKENFLNRMGRS